MLSAIILSTLALGQLCDKYTTAVFTNNTEENQLKLLTAVVNTVVLGNQSVSVTGEAVPSLFAPAEFNGEKIEFLPYFDGTLETTNVNGKPGKVNFLDGTDAGSKQTILLNHLYQVFGALLGCSKQGTFTILNIGGQIFPAYQGDSSMYETHKFMKLNKNQISYFNTQVGKAAMSLGVTAEDASAVGKTLEATFNVQCAAPIQLGGLDGPQGLCATSECDVASPKVCPADFSLNGQTGPTGSNNGTTGSPMSFASGMFDGALVLVVGLLSLSL